MSSVGWGETGGLLRATASWLLGVLGSQGAPLTLGSSEDAGHPAGMGVCSPPASVSLTSLTFIHKHAHVDCVLRVSAATFTPLLPKVTTVPLSYLLQLPRPVSSLLPPSHPLLWPPRALLPATNSALGCNEAIKMDGTKSRTSSVPTGPQRRLCVPGGQSRR